MAWDEEMPIIVRGLIQDWGTPATYTDENLIQIILIAALSVQMDAVFPIRYAVDVVNQTITPDFTDSAASTRSDALINLVALKSACMLVNGENKMFTGQGISIRDGTSAVSLQRSPAALALVNKTYCGAYADALFNYKTNGEDGQGSGLGEAIVGPFKYYEFVGDSVCYPLIDGGSTYGGDCSRGCR